jgi:hypothetical protein
MFEQDILVEWGKNAGIHSSIFLTKPICKYWKIYLFYSALVIKMSIYTDFTVLFTEIIKCNILHIINKILH